MTFSAERRVIYSFCEEPVISGLPSSSAPHKEDKVENIPHTDQNRNIPPLVQFGKLTVTKKGAEKRTLT